MIGAPPGYTFTACPQRLPVDYKVFPESAKIYEIDRGHVVFGMELYSGPVYRINLRDGSSEEIARKACLLGTYQRMPVVSVHEDDRTVRIQVLGGAFPTKGTMMWDGLGGYYTDMVNRTSPCGEYYLYDAARLSGFRLRIAKIGPHGAQSTLSSLGRITSVGSWWAGAALTTQPSSIAQ
jgi:hypothetical protein